MRLWLRELFPNSSQEIDVITNHPLVATLEASYAEYDKVYVKNIYSGKGKDVAALDHERDLAYRNMKAFLNGYRKLTVVTNYNMAEELYQVFKTFGLDFDRLSYSSQNVQMKKLIETVELTEKQTEDQDPFP